MIKRILIAVLFAPLLALAQTYPSPTFQNVTINGTLSNANAAITGGSISGISPPIPVASGGTGAATASGTALDNITGFNSTGFISRGGAGSYSFSSRINLTNLANQAANTVVANVTSGSTTPTAFAMPGCSTTSSAIQYTTNTGFTCGTVATSGANSNITSLTGLTTALATSEGGLGVNNGSASGVPVFSSGVATVTTTTGTGFPVLAASPALTGTPVAPTSSLGTNNAQLATTAFVSNRGPCADILDFGGNNAGSANNDTALTSALAAASNTTNSKCVYFPPGQYNFSAQYVYTFNASYQSVTIIGAGQDNTVLYWAAGGGLAFNFKSGTDSIHVSDLSVTTGTTNTGAGIFLTNSYVATSSAAMSTIQRVTVRGNDGYFATDYWQYGIEINGVSSVNLDSVQAIGPGTAAGTGLIIFGTSSIVPIIYNISNSSFNNFQYGFQYGNYVQGVQISNCNFTNDNIGIYIPSGESGLDQLSISNSQFNVLAGNPNISIASAVGNLQVSNNLFLVNNNSSGINMSATSTTTITGNSFEPNTGSPTNVYGIVITGWTNAGGVITGNSFFNLTGGISLQTSSKNFNVQSNVYQANATNTANTGTGNVIGGGSP